MRHTINILLGTFLALSIAACFSSGGNTMKPISGASSYYLSDDELSLTKEMALNGDAKKAFQVYQHYAMGKSDIISSFPWLQIAANKNDSDAQYAIGYTYLHIDLFKNISLAKFWLNEATKNGSIIAKDLLIEIQLEDEKVSPQ